MNIGVVLAVNEAGPYFPRPFRQACLEFVMDDRAFALLTRLTEGVEQQKGILLENTLRFVRGLPANNAMLWGARGNGKSSLVKAVHAEANARRPGCMVLIEIHREDIR